MSEFNDPDAVARLLAIVASFYALPAEDKADEAGIHLRTALRALAAICGPELIGAAYNNGNTAHHDGIEDDDRAQRLEAISERLMICSHLFAGIEQPGVGDGIADVAREAHFVANGDKPQLFAPIGGKQGKRNSTYKIAVCELRALEWEAYFLDRGEPAGSYQKRIASAYGAEWGTLMKRRKPLEAFFGKDLVDYKLAVAQRLATSGQPLGILEVDGAQYLVAKGYRA